MKPPVRHWLYRLFCSHKGWLPIPWNQRYYCGRCGADVTALEDHDGNA